jgi:hypothetical protein
MSYQVLTLPACEQTEGDRAIMARFPGVFTSGTSTCAMTSEEMANWQILPADSTEPGKIYQGKKVRK